MRFMMMYRPDRPATAACQPSPEHMAEMGRFIDQMIKEGHLLATEGLHPMAAGARVRRSGATMTVTDGPYIEAKEVIGGFAMIQAKSKDEAIALAKRFLAVAGDGETEIRPVFEPTDFSPEVLPPEEVARDRVRRDEMQKRAAAH